MGSPILIGAQGDYNMIQKQDWDLYWECTIGKKSHLNFIGKIIFLPLIVFLAIMFFCLDLLFSKSI